MPAAVRREKEGHLSLHVALNRPEASALAPDSRPYDGARCTPLELRHVRTWNAKARSRRRETRRSPVSMSTSQQPRRSISGRLDARIMAAKRPKDSLSWQNVLGWQWLSEKSRCASHACNRREKKGDLHSTCHLTGTVSPSKSTRRERTCETRADDVVCLHCSLIGISLTFMAR